MRTLSIDEPSENNLCTWKWFVMKMTTMTLPLFPNKLALTGKHFKMRYVIDG
jgi:hypothetical protein